MKVARGKRSLTRKFLGYMILIGLVPLVFFGLLSILNTNAVLKDNTLTFYRQFAEQRKQYITLVMSDVESLIANLSGIDEIQDALGEDASDSSFNKLTTQAQIGYILSGYTSLKGLVSIDIFSAYGNHFHVGETLNAANIDATLLERLTMEAAASSDFVYWSGIETSINKDSQYSHVVTAVKQLTNRSTPDGGKPADGLLVVSYDPAVFTSGMSEYENGKGYTLILDRQRRVLFHRDVSILGQKVSTGIASSFSNGDGSFEQRIDGSDMLVVYAGIADADWTVASFFPLSSIYERSRLVSVLFAGLLLLSIGVIAFFGMLVSRQVVQPIKRVTDTFRALQRGELADSIRFNRKSGDEIGELGNLFDSFIDAREDITMQKKLERRLNEQNAELQVALDRLKTTQIQMLQQEKMAGIGQLAAGVAHEINNPLGFVSGNFGILEKYFQRINHVLDICLWIRDNTPVESEANDRISTAWRETRMDQIRKQVNELITDTQEGLRRIAAIVSGLRSFSRINRNDERSGFDFNEGIRMTLLVANNELKYACEVAFHPGDIPSLQANGGQINQVLLNVLINSVHAIKVKYDAIRANSGQEHAEKGRIDIETWVEGDFVCCRIRDDGCGMNADVKNHMFEPFFTTKPVGQGTGLGLGIAYDILVNKHGGTIEVDSEPGEGTAVTIRLPIDRVRQEDDEL